MNTTTINFSCVRILGTYMDLITRGFVHISWTYVVWFDLSNHTT